MSLNNEHRAALAALDRRWAGGDSVDPTEVARAVVQWRAALKRPATPDEERFDVVDEAGEPLGWTAPRWFCHLSGLRHRVVQILLTSPQGLQVLQMRASDKADWPMHLDTTAGGHLKAGQSWGEGAVAELAEEVGLGLDDLEGPLEPVGAPYDRHDLRDDPWLINRQINRLYLGTLTPSGLARAHFPDREVAGLYLCHDEELDRMIAADVLVDPGLRQAIAQLRAHGR